MTEFMEFIRGYAYERPLRSDLVAGHEPIEAVERGVLDSLGHDGRGQLLPLGDEIGLGRIVQPRLAEQRGQQIESAAESISGEPMRAL